MSPVLVRYHAFCATNWAMWAIIQIIRHRIIRTCTIRYTHHIHTHRWRRRRAAVRRHRKPCLALMDGHRRTQLTTFWPVSIIRHFCAAHAHRLCRCRRSNRLPPLPNTKCPTPRIHSSHIIAIKCTCKMAHCRYITMDWRIQTGYERALVVVCTIQREQSFVCECVLCECVHVTKRCVWDV